jgi:hypothetical protein
MYYNGLRPGGDEERGLRTTYPSDLRGGRNSVRDHGGFRVGEADYLRLCVHFCDTDIGKQGHRCAVVDGELMTM